MNKELYGSTIKISCSLSKQYYECFPFTNLFINIQSLRKDSHINDIHLQNHHTNTTRYHFQKFHSGERFQKVAFSVIVFIAYVWMIAESVAKKLRFRRNCYVWTGSYLRNTMSLRENATSWLPHCRRVKGFQSECNFKIKVSYFSYSHTSNPPPPPAHGPVQVQPG